MRYMRPRPTSPGGVTATRRLAVGWMDRALAKAKVTTDQARQLGRELAADLDEEFGSSPEYQEMKAAASRTRVRAVHVATEVKVAAADALTTAGDTTAGQKVGEGTRRAAAVLSKAPVVTAVTDAAKARHGVELLFARLQEAPENPLPAVWLAEALDRVYAGLDKYQRLRSVTSLTYALGRQALLSAAELGAVPSDPTRTRLLKRAYAQARLTLRQQPRDGHSLHVLARVYLAQGQADQAVRAAKASLIITPDDGLAWVTLARCYEARGMHASAEKAARRAVELGADYGYEVLARRALSRGQQEQQDLPAEYEALRAKVTPAGRAAYLGVAVTGEQAVKQVKDEQRRKAAEVLDWMRS